MLQTEEKHDKIFYISYLILNNRWLLYKVLEPMPNLSVYVHICIHMWTGRSLAISIMFFMAISAISELAQRELSMEIVAGFVRICSHTKAVCCAAVRAFLLSARADPTTADTSWPPPPPPFCPFCSFLLVAPYVLATSVTVACHRTISRCTDCNKYLH